MENIHSDVSAGIAAAFGTTVITILATTYVWAGASFVSMASDELSFLARLVARPH